MPVQITPFTTTPSRANPTTFSADMDTRLAQENSRIIEMNLQSEENNVINANVNAKEMSASAFATASQNSALESANSANIAQGAANYQGSWLIGTTYNKGESVSFNGRAYYSKVDLNVGNEPTGIEDENWFIQVIDTGVLSFTTQTISDVELTVPNTAIDTTRVIPISTTIDLYFNVGTNPWIVAYDKITETFGAVVQWRTGTLDAGKTNFVIVNTSTILIASVITTALEVVAVSLSGTTITLGTPATSTLGGTPNADKPMQFVAVGTSYILGYQRATNVHAVRACTVSGTTVTMSAETLLTSSSIGDGYVIIYPLSATEFITTHFATTTSYVVTPFTVSGTTLTKGTEVATVTTATTREEYGLLSTGRAMVTISVGGIRKPAVVSASGNVAAISVYSGTPSISITDSYIGSALYYVVKDSCVMRISNNSLWVFKDNNGVCELPTTTTLIDNHGNGAFVFEDNKTYHAYSGVQENITLDTTSGTVTKEFIVVDNSIPLDPIPQYIKMVTQHGLCNKRINYRGNGSYKLPLYQYNFGVVFDTVSKSFKVRNPLPGIQSTTAMDIVETAYATYDEYIDYAITDTNKIRLIRTKIL